MTKSLNTFYESYAAEWETPLRKKYEELASEWKGYIFCELLPKNVKLETILDMGCGPGNILKYVGKRTGAKQLIGIDISKTMTRMARKNLENAILMQGMDFSFYNKKVDLIILSDILEHVHDPLKMLDDASLRGKYILLKMPIEKSFIKTIYHKLRGGVPLGTEHPEGHLHIWKKNDILDLVKKSKLSIIKYEIASPPYTILNFKKKKYPFTKNILRSIFYKSESITAKYSKNVSCFLFESNIFILCKPKKETDS